MIILFCGIPGSGKTTTAGILAQRLSELGPVQLVSSDNLRGSVYRRLLKSIKSGRGTKHFLILDATFYKKEWRRQVKAQAGAEVVITVYFDCQLQVALERNQKRRPNVSARVVHIMYRKLEPPQHPCVRIDSATTSPAKAAAKVFDFIISSGGRKSRAERAKASTDG